MSFVATLTTDAGTTSNPSLQDIERAVTALDGSTLTLVVLAPASPKGPPEGDHHMAIGGGNEGRCVVYITDDNVSFWNLEDLTPPPGSGRYMMVVGGQEGDYREAQCVPKEWAMRAARRYFEDGARAPELPWIES